MTTVQGRTTFSALLQKQAFLLAMHDVFFVMVGLALLGLITAVLLEKKPPAARASQSGSAPHPEKEASAC